MLQNKVVQNLLFADIILEASIKRSHPNQGSGSPRPALEGRAMSASIKPTRTNCTYYLALSLLERKVVPCKPHESRKHAGVQP